MSAIIPSTRKAGTCVICQDQFTESDTPLTHAGGEGHEGFHKTCLKEWLIHQPVCPIDRQNIDRSSLVSRMELIRARLETAMANAGWAACFGTLAAVVGRVATAGANKAGSSAQIAKAPLIGIGAAQVAGAIFAGALAVGAAAGGGIVAREIGIGEIGIDAAITAGALAVDRMITVGTEQEAAIGAAMAGYMGLYVGGSVGWGMCVGGWVTAIAGEFFNKKYAEQISLLGTPLIIGASAGILSLIRGK